MVVKRDTFRRRRFTELTDSQWEIIKQLVDNGRKRQHCLRTIINAILKITRTGAQWRNMDEKYPPWQSVYYYFRKWQRCGVWSEVLSYLVQKERLRQGRKATASRLAVDSQSTKTGTLISIETGVDGNKKINGRKRHLAVDALGLPFAMHVSAANISDSEAGLDLLWQLESASDRLELICGDKAYRGDFSHYATYYKWVVQITQKPPSQKGFIPQSGRWQVERSFAWFKFFRRLAVDHEKTVESSVAFMQTAFIDIILSRFP